MTNIKAQISNEYQMTNAKKICPSSNSTSAYTKGDAQSEKE